MITKEQLIDAGWKECNDPIDPTVIMEKDLTLYDEEDNEDERAEKKISLIIHQMYGVPLIALQLPDGMLGISAETIEDLVFFEKMIMGYDSNY